MGLRRLVGRSVVVVLLAVPLWAQGGGASLKTITIPTPPDLDTDVLDRDALGVLGKALFWDVQLSSDSTIACATCHFHAGADHRRQHQLATVKDPVQQNWSLASGDFPFNFDYMAAGHRAGSSGVFPRTFLAPSHGGEAETGVDAESDAYPSLHGLNLRQVTRRNAPSVINSVFVFRNFWDGRASNVFTGRSPFGDDDADARVLVDEGGRLVARKIQIQQAGLASQAVGPPLESVEMSYAGRSWAALGRKMMAARQLALQHVAPDDSVLGRYASATSNGLSSEFTYESLIHRAFRPEFWRSLQLVDDAGAVVSPAADAVDHRGFLPQEYNFPLFLGLAIQAYETTLISDESPYDRFLDGKPDALSDLELTGLEMFQRRNCSTCHIDPELSLANYSGVFGYGPYKGLGPDAGFFNTGVEPFGNDAGASGEHGIGPALSRAPLLRGAFKTPSLRNVEFTGPYFHTGSKSTLEQIIDFYTAGGDYPAGNLRRWGPDARERVAMPALMRAFSDDRVRFERAPFDHPELCVPDGHRESEPALGPSPSPSPSRRLPDRWALVPAVGRDGNTVPLQTFEELLLGIGNDGSRAHTLVESCRLP